MTGWLRVRGSELRPGMVVFKAPEAKKEYRETIGKLTGRCEKGIHYGSGCYDLIGIWWKPYTIRSSSSQN